MPDQLLELPLRLRDLADHRSEPHPCQVRVVDRVGRDLDPGVVHLEDLCVRHIEGLVDESAHDVGDRCESVCLEDREGGRVQVLVAVVECHHDRACRQRPDAVEVVADMVEVHRVVAVPVQPVHLALEVRHRHGELEAQRVRPNRGRLADVVVHEDGQPNRRRAQGHYLVPRDEVFAVAGPRRYSQYRSSLDGGDGQARGLRRAHRCGEGVVGLDQIRSRQEQRGRDPDAAGHMPHGR